MNVITRTRDKVQLYFNWRNRLRVLSGLPITIESERVTTLTQSQFSISVSVGDGEVTTIASEPSSLRRNDDAVPCVPWCSIIE